MAAVDALDPPGRVAADLDASLTLALADLPVGRQAVLVGVEVLREPEIALTTARETDVAADPRDAERQHLVAVEIVPDHVPLAAVEQERVRVDRALLLLVALDRPVRELDGAVLGDRALELRQPARELR